MATLHDQITTITSQLIKTFASVKDQKELEDARIAFLGRNGHLAELMNQLKTLSLEEKKAAGPALNALKQLAETTYNTTQKTLRDAIVHEALEKQKDFDVTAYKATTLPGHTHIYTQVTQDLENIFISMGYDIADGPEVETDYYNFQALNIPSDHPARDMHDTFWLTIPGMLLRTHTSTVQTHSMEHKSLPLAIFAPGRAFRNEATDASHDFQFTQGEGLVIAKDVSIANLLATAKAFLQAFFEKEDLNIRVRPGYFPFVEPGVEIDASCPFCGGKGCSPCKHTGWIELLGAGLVHPNVLRSSGIDPEVYSGFAFGFGIERLTMIKYGINDIRLFHSSKVHFLDQF
ncbi:MAG: phenylalanine--tRNA ligase subunit alpha [Candidatus Dependentiae bacterium]|nr:phenylalanine--tRNA ligase subunit alpha [Candidatus Dependentiae bacterium]